MATRQLLNGSAIGLGAILTFSISWAYAGGATKQTADAIPTKLRTALHQEIEVHATPDRVYAALLNSKQFAAFTGAPADIGGKAGGSLSMFGGMVTGRNIELVPGHRIVQAWRPGSWEAGVYSVVKFELKPSGTNTLIVLDHTGFPEGDYESLSSGWVSHYWDRLKKYFP